MDARKRGKASLVLGLCAGVVFYFMGAASGLTKDPDYPTKPINFYIGWTVGGTTDMAARPLVEAASQHLGQPIVPINRPGASGALAATSVMTAAPDGYTLGASASSNLVVAPLSGDVPYKDLSGFTQIMNFGVYLYTIMVRSDAPWKTWKEFTEWAKKNPGGAKIGITGAKSADIKGIALWQVEKREQMKFGYVAFKGSAEVLTNILGGHINMYGASIDPSTMTYVKEGKLRPLLYLCKEKMAGYETIPSVEELYGIRVPNFMGVFGPKGLPEYVLRKLDDAFGKAVKDTRFANVMNQMCTPVVYMPRDKMKEHVEKDFLEVSKVIKLLKAEEAAEKK
jgi:tripartite-type tricarboxylate transporter receptor subunit TctC